MWYIRIYGGLNEISVRISRNPFEGLITVHFCLKIRANNLPLKALSTMLTSFANKFGHDFFAFLFILGQIWQKVNSLNLYQLSFLKLRQVEELYSINFFQRFI